MRKKLELPFGETFPPVLRQDDLQRPVLYVLECGESYILEAKVPPVLLDYGCPTETDGGTDSTVKAGL